MSLKKLVSNGKAFTLPVILAIILSLLVVYLQGNTIFPSGFFDSRHNLVFWSDVLFHDSNVHLSLIGELLNRFPPTNFATATGELKNYHFLFDVVVAVLHKLTTIPVLDLYYRLVPAVLSLSLSFVVYKSLMTLTHNRWTSALGIFFTILTTSWGAQTPYLKAFFGLQPVTPASNLYMTDQLLSMLVNPQGQLSLIIFLTLFLLLNFYETSKKVIALIVFATLLGLSFGFKAYGGIVFAPAAVLCGLYYLVRLKDPKPLVAVLAGLAIMALWIAFTIDGKVAGLAFAPFWLLDHMMSDLDKLNEPRFLLLKDHYLQSTNWLRLLSLNLIAMAIYIIGSSGLRIFGLISVISLVRQKSLPLSAVFLFCAAGISLTLPIFFNQSKKAYDTVQFTPYFTLFMGLMFSVAIFTFVNILKNRYLKAFVLLSTLILVTILNMNEISIRFRPRVEKIVIPASTVEAMEFIRIQTPPDSVFLLAPTEFNRHYLAFSSLSQRRTTYSGLDFAFQVGADSQALTTEWENSFTQGLVASPFDYLFVPNLEEDYFAKIRENYQFESVFDNGSVKVLKRI